MVCIKKMNAKSVTMNDMFYIIISIKECDELSTDTFAISYQHTNLTTDPAPSDRILSYDLQKSNIADLFTDALSKMNKLYIFQYLNDLF